MNKNPYGPMLNAYPDSMGGKLGDIVKLLQSPELKGAFTSFYILPSIFNTDLDRGFSIISYDISETLADPEDLPALQELGIDLKLDFVLNHLSVLSDQFQDILKKGDDSEYRDFFIDWNRFWEGHGTMTEAGYIEPDPDVIRDMFFRKPGLPILMVRMPDGRDVPYWNTFYQEVRYDPVDAQDLMAAMPLQYGTAQRLAETVNQALAEGKTPPEIDFGALGAYRDAVVNVLEGRRKYLGQMDLNIHSPLVMEYYRETLKKLAGYGAAIVRLDAFAYAPKEVGERNFFNDPGTWDLLAQIREMADACGLRLLPEIHTAYEERRHEEVAAKGYMVYDFFLPGLMIDALESRNPERLAAWACELLEKKIRTVNMLGCHDGIPLLDLKGLLSDERIDELVEILMSRGGGVKNLHAKKKMYYQVNATYFSAIGEDERRLLLARAVQMFMPGKPQIWYLDLFAGKNDHEAVKRAGANGHKEINRTNLSVEQVRKGLKRPVVSRQIELLRMRAGYAVFHESADISAKAEGSRLEISWEAEGQRAVLSADFDSLDISIRICETASGNVLYTFTA